MNTYIEFTEEEIQALERALGKFAYEQVYVMMEKIKRAKLDGNYKDSDVEHESP